MTEKLKEYVVVKKNTLDHSVGDKIKLTDKKAKALSGKVELVKVAEEPKKVKPKARTGIKRLINV
jgi:hypothetical protein